MTAPTRCASCDGRLTAAERAGYQPGRPMIACSACTGITEQVSSGPWQPLMEWHDGREGLRLASPAPIPWENPRVALIRVTRAGAVTTVRTLTGKREMLAGADPSDLLLAAWPGDRRQDVFIVDNPAAALAAITR